LPPGRPSAALATGIGMVHQHFTLAENLSVLDNVMLGTEPLWQPFSRRRAARAQLAEAASRFGLSINADARVGDLSVGERQRVEILKALVRGARILILDEPTAVLTPQESQSLFATLKRLVLQGMAIVFISHKLDEVLAVSDRVAVLRNGRLVADLPVAGADRAMLAEAMVGRAVPRVAREPTMAGAALPAAPACTLRGVWLHAAGRRPTLAGIDLDVHGGEIVAIAGVAGNGQRALADMLSGLIAPDSGTLAIGGAALPANPRAWVEAGVARIPEDRQSVGAIGDMTIWENALLERYAGRRFATWGWLRTSRARAHASRIVERFDVRGGAAQGLDAGARTLSGGNLQKLILGRALTGAGDHAEAPRLVVAHQPTWGLDVGAVADLHRRLIEACAAGAGVLLISEDLDEILVLADRIAVMSQGRLSAARARSQWTLAELGLAMAGQDQAGMPAPSTLDAQARHAA
jgi:simple sugar transport system ATP-binding protein